MTPVINVNPSSVVIELGESIQIQIDTNIPDFDVVNHNDKVCYFDKKHLEIKGLSIGYSQIDLIVESDGQIAKASIAISVEDVKSQGSVRYMLHNRNTNRLITGVANKINELDLTFWLGLSDKDKGEFITDGLQVGLIATPVIITPDKDTNSFKGTIKTSDFQSLLGVTDLKHTHTEWQIATDKQFLNVVHTEFKYNYKLTEYGTKFIGKNFYYRVRYYSNETFSPWSEPRAIMNTDIGVDTLTNIKTGNIETALYYGEITKNRLVENFDYRGDYFTLLCNNIVNFKAGQVVKYGGSLWRCIEDYRVDATNNFTKALHPGGDNTKYMLSPFILRPYRRMVARDEIIKINFLTNDNVINITPTYNNLNPNTWEHKGKLYKDGDDKYIFMFKCHNNGTQPFTVTIILQQPTTEQEYRITVPFTIAASIDVNDTPENADYIDMPESLNDEILDNVITNDENKVLTFEVTKPSAIIVANVSSVTNQSFFFSNNHINVPYTVYPKIVYPWTGENYTILSGGKRATITTARNGYTVVSYSGDLTNDTYYPYYGMIVARTHGYSTKSKWVEEKRKFIPTVSWLMDRIGIGFGAKDNNLDRFTFGSVSVGEMLNTDEGWLKFNINGRLIYIYKKPICEAISWVDLARRDVVYGNRTIRIGSRLYYIRLLKEEEYKECLMSDLTGFTKEELGLSELEFIEDFQEGGLRKTIDSNGDIREIDPKNRIGKYRPVLELIPQGSEPYNNLPKMPPAENELFRYDPITDTGFFGEVLSANFVNGTTLNKLMNFSMTEGAEINQNEGWLKFYWHGLFFLLSKKAIRRNISYNMLYERNLIHYKDTGNNSKVSLKQNDIVYTIGCMDRFRAEPYQTTEYTHGPLNHSQSNLWNMPLNINIEMGKFSKWNEIIYRLIRCYGSGQSTEAPYWNPRHFYYTQHHSGLQIGDNWADYLPENLMCKSSVQRGPGYVTTSIRNLIENNNDAITFQYGGHWSKDSMFGTSPSGDWTGNYTPDINYYTDVSWGPLLHIEKDIKTISSNINILENKDWSTYPNIIPDVEKLKPMEYEVVDSNTEFTISLANSETFEENPYKNYKGLMKTIKRYKGVDNIIHYYAKNPDANRIWPHIYRPRYFDELHQKLVYGQANANNGVDVKRFMYEYQVSGSVSEVLSRTIRVPIDFVEYPTNPNWHTIIK